MEEYKDLEDSYHELIVEHGKKRKIVQSLLLEIDEYKQKSDAAEQDIKEAMKIIEQIQSMFFTNGSKNR